ncbi:DEAD/DEAH box helicase family protein [Verrucomicrobia bacterium]|nr:DEAD/DEAH box helicase family protein [Verrucomicrobiota bacterium]
MELGKIHTQLLKLKSWREFTRLCDNLLTDPSGRKQAGNLFEELTRLYLLTTSEHATKIKAVRHHSEIPTKLLNQLGLVRPEIGVDLLVELKNGRYWAVQAKYRSDFTKNLPLSALSGFQAIAARQLKHSKDFSHWIVATSNYDLSTKAYSLFPKMGLIGFADFSAMAENEFKAIHEYIRRGRVKPKPFRPRKHQKQAVKAVSKFFTDNSATRGKIIHPCGSGKSLTGFWISQVLKSRSVLIAVPSLALVRQILRDWTRECQANGIDVDWMAVCSDEGVKDSDDTSTKTADLGIEVDTDPKVVAKFLSKKSRILKVIVTTYQSGQVVIDAAKKSKAKFDLGIFDEAHKTVGIVGKKWGKLLRDENVKVARRIFMTATEKQYRGNSDQFDSMDDEALYGPIIHQLSFKAALEQKPPILSDYKIVTTIVTSSQIAELIRNNTFVRSSGKD